MQLVVRGLLTKDQILLGTKKNYSDSEKKLSHILKIVSDV